MATKHDIFAEVIVSFECLLSNLVELMGHLMNDKRLGILLFRDSNTPFNITLKYFKTIYEHKIEDGELKKKYKRIYENLTLCSKYRNEVAHSTLSTTFNEDKSVKDVHFISPKDSKEWTEEKLIEYVSLIWGTCYEINDLLGEFEKDIHK